MADVARPRLAEVLAALTGVAAWDRRVSIELDAAGASGAHGGFSQHYPWENIGPADAQETLVARGLLPDGWCGDVRRRWCCATCGGTGSVRKSETLWFLCDWCIFGVTDHAATIPDLVAVASLGWDAIQRAEELAREACAALREYGCPQPERVVWRVGERDGLRRVWSERRRGVWCDLRASGGVSVDDGALRRGFYNDRVAELWDSGLALDATTADAVRIVVPPVGGSDG